MSEYRGHSAKGLDDAYRSQNSQPEQRRRRQSGGGSFLFWFTLFGAVLYGLFVYLPGQLDERYAGSGAVINVVQPNGNDPVRDQQYADVNQDNAEANLTNSKAEQRRASIPMGWVFGLGILGVIVFMFSAINKSVTPPKI